MTLAILHVDDEPDIREVAAFSLELDPGITLTTAESGETALELLQGGMRPDVILLDVMMPRLDGPGTLAQLRTLPGLETTPVIFMTARVQASEQDRYLALGAIGVIVKPFDPMTLAAQVRALLAEGQA
ncbi:response regulator [Brevundimonas sp.]|jgi:CheY-like chemotaxis protein|uniref:response regulator n=1 Tax=Brevundimonas sp. TaxID=1871086 RepID=UPI003F6FC24C